jgi:hypothetical protein
MQIKKHVLRKMTNIPFRDMMDSEIKKLITKLVLTTSHSGFADKV